MERRLPLYLVLDVSGSMSGDPIEAVNNGLQTIQSALFRNSQARETVWISVITFGGTVKQIMPLTEVQSFVPPVLQAGGGTPFGEALRKVKNLAETEVRKNTYTEKGDWKPMVFIMTDGEPTDSYDTAITEFKSYKWGPVIACAAGAGANTAILKKVTESVYSLDTLDSAKIGSLFVWLSSSISAVSKKIDEVSSGSGSSVLPPPPPEIKFV